jgi:hypothetical protein
LEARSSFLTVTVSVDFISHISICGGSGKVLGAGTCDAFLPGQGLSDHS